MNRTRGKIRKSSHQARILAALGVVAASTLAATVLAAIGTPVVERPPELPAAPIFAGSTRESQARVKARCAECAVIESIRRLPAAGTAPAMYEITVRMRDGSIRVNREATPADWRPGQRILYLAGPVQPGG